MCITEGRKAAIMVRYAGYSMKYRNRKRDTGAGYTCPSVMIL